MLSARIFPVAHRDDSDERSRAGQEVVSLAAAVAKVEVVESEGCGHDDAPQAEDEEERNRDDSPCDQKVVTHTAPRCSFGRILVFCLAAASALFHITAHAAVPSYVADGSTQELSGTSASLKFRANIGSPSNGDLVVLFVACFDLTNTNATTLNTPSGWTQELHRQSGDTFGDQAVYWRKADGSEGATLDLTVQNNSTECSAWYYRFTGHDATDPVDATDIAWADSTSKDPPSQTVASGPRDVYYLAFAHTRGDNTWSSGPGMTSDSHLNSTLAGGRTVGVGRQSASSSSSLNPTAVAFSGTSRTGAAITAVVYSPAGGGTPSFTAGPSYSTVSNTAISATFTASASSLTYYCALYLKGASAPTAAQIAAGTNAHSAVATGTTTGSSESHNMTPSDSPTFPAYDPYCVVKTGGGTYSSVPTTSATCTSAPTNYQYVNCPGGLSSISAGSPFAVATLGYDAQTANFVVGELVTGGSSSATALVQSDSDSGSTGTLTLQVVSGAFTDNESLAGSVNGAATANGSLSYLFAAGDIPVLPSLMSPGAMAPTGLSDATISYHSGGERETALNIAVYDLSAGQYSAADVDWVNNDPPPSCSGGTVNQFVALHTAIATIDLDDSCVHQLSDALTSVAIGTLPTGLSLNGSTNQITGTPTAVTAGGMRVRFVLYDTYGSIAIKDYLFVGKSLPVMRQHYTQQTVH
jgi:hypothetical protein